MGEDVIGALKALGSIVVIAAQTVAIVCMAAWMFPVRCALLVGFAGASVLTSVYIVVGVLFYGALTLVLWNVVGRVAARVWGELRITAAYQWLVGRRLYSAWRRWWLYERRWQRVLARQSLTDVIAHDYDQVPKLSKVTCTRSGDLVRVRVLHGQTPADFTGHDGQTARNLAKAFKARECRVADIPQTDYVTLDLPRGGDPLADIVPFPGVPRSTADVDLRRIPIGVDEHGRTVTIPVHGSHIIVAGQTGAGKGSVFWSIILHLIPFIREGSVRLHAIDPKRGVELNPGRNLFHAFADTDDQIPVLLGKAVTVMDENSDYIKGRTERKLTPTPERPLNVIFVDELGRLADDKDCQESIRTLVNVGRAPGCSVVAAAQNATKAVIRDRDEFPGMVCLRLKNLDSARKLLGRAAHAAGARPEEIPDSLPGVGYVQVDKAADELEAERPIPRWLSWLPWVSPADASVAMIPTRFRAFHVTDELIATVNESFAPVDEPEAAEPVPA